MIDATILGAMAAAIATLWKVNESKNSKAITKLEADIKDCLHDRAYLRKKLDETREKLGLESKCDFED